MFVAAQQMTFCTKPVAEPAPAQKALSLRRVNDSLPHTKSCLCPTWGFVLQGQAGPQEDDGPGVYR